MFHMNDQIVLKIKINVRLVWLFKYMELVTLVFSIPLVMMESTDIDEYQAWKESAFVLILYQYLRLLQCVTQPQFPDGDDFYHTMKESALDTHKYNKNQSTCNDKKTASICFIFCLMMSLWRSLMVPLGAIIEISDVDEFSTET